jgi:hypothetical protein
LLRRNKKVAMKLMIIFTLLFSNLGLVYGQSPDKAENAETSENVVKATDLKGNWAEASISRWLDQGLITGYADKTFKPGNKISRAEFVAIVNRAFGLMEQDQQNYKDVPKDKWYYSEIAKAKLAGYISGFEDGSFMPEANVSRQEAAKMIYELMKLNEKSDISSLNGFKDAGQIPQWSSLYLNAVIAAGYMSGYPDQTLRPLQTITRAEAVVLLDKAVGTLIQSSGTEKYGYRGRFVSCRGNR